MFNKKAILALMMMSSALVAKSPNKANKKDKAEIVETQEQDKPVDMHKLSITFGHMIAKSLNDMGVKVDIDAVIIGLKESNQGIAPPLTEAECISAVTAVQKKAFEELASKNLNDAEAFLKTEAEKESITSIENGKVLYQVIQEGNGEAVQDQGKIAFKYKGSLLNGEVFGQSDKEEVMDINLLVPGLKQALVGMKEGEKRIIHIHPEKGYGTNGMLPPNSLLSFEIEIAKAKIEEAQAEQISQENSEPAIEAESSIR